jgi:undecaprenyl-diphosphatase
MYLLSHFDEDLNVSVNSIYHGTWKKYFDAIDYFGYVSFTGPISIGIAGMTMLGRDKKLQDAAFSSVEAVVFNTLATTVAKLLIGRDRPDAGAGAHTFAPFTDPDSSFPSGHASTAFAFITPWVVYYPKPYTYLLLIFPASTAISRMVLNRHWFTDVLTGSVLGALIGYNLAKWHKDLALKNNYYSTQETGLLISFSIPIR